MDTTSRSASPRVPAFVIGRVLEIFGPTHLQTAAARVARGEALGAMGRTPEARILIQSAIADLQAGNHAQSQTAKDAAAALSALADGTTLR